MWRPKDCLEFHCTTGCLRCSEDRQSWLKCSGLGSLNSPQCHPCNPGTQLIQLLQPNPVKTKPADDPKRSNYPADPNPLDILEMNTFITLHTSMSHLKENKNDPLPIRNL